MYINSFTDRPSLKRYRLFGKPQTFLRKGKKIDAPLTLMNNKSCICSYWLQSEQASWENRSGGFGTFIPLEKVLSNPLLTKLYQSRWPYSFFAFFNWPRLRLCSSKSEKKKTKKNKKKTLCQYPAILTSCLVNNAYTALEVLFEWSHHRIPFVQAHKLLSHLTIRHYLC